MKTTEGKRDFLEREKRYRRYRRYRATIDEE
jgi:hypothetical protein